MLLLLESRVVTLTGDDLFAWLALRRVEYHRLTELGGRYLDTE